MVGHSPPARNARDGNRRAIRAPHVALHARQPLRRIAEPSEDATLEEFSEVLRVPIGFGTMAPRLKRRPTMPPHNEELLGNGGTVDDHRGADHPRTPFLPRAGPNVTGEEDPRAGHNEETQPPDIPKLQNQCRARTHELPGTRELLGIHVTQDSVPTKLYGSFPA